MKNSEDSYVKARKRVKELKEFYNHLFSYIFVNILLAGINYYSNAWAYPWFLWVVGGWGIGLAFDALKVFRLNPFFSKNWEERKIEEYMNEEKKQRWE
ncbi:2TM domain-containing protein [Salegentibacter echinorum]|uniref:2TM domain-containing protein n=1 Tax=Salegentibacter echinorum TaxID=1073325 RepID=A0A1M5CEZ9_SALEC|nr:2TM domain-containing protein [Salegentibacter echinorum]SHF53177.1 2TM domain-containing protein [Salegentibacter echinorum]